MANPLFQAMGGNNSNQNMQMNNVKNMFDKIMQFKNGKNINPQQEVMQMVNSGKLSQNQLNMAQQAANNIQQLFNQFGFKF